MGGVDGSETKLYARDDMSSGATTGLLRLTRRRCVKSEEYILK